MRGVTLSLFRSLPAGGPEAKAGAGASARGPGDGEAAPATTHRPALAAVSQTTRRPAAAPLLRGGPAMARLRPVRRHATATAPAAQDADDTFDSAYALGWDHARHGLVPPLERLCINPQLQRGFRAGRDAFGRVQTRATTAVRRWLALRLRALAEGRTYETEQLTPHYLGQLAAEHCPVTRERLTQGDTEGRDGAPTDAGIERLRDDAGYAGGHLVTLSRRAAAALSGRGHAELCSRWRAARAGGDEPRAARPEGPSATAWGRLAVLSSFVTPMEHDAAARLPLLVLPPNRLRLFSPVQALQALATRALLHETPSRRLAAIREALPAPLRAAFDGWVVAMRERLDAELVARSGEPARWALEDCWADRRVVARWRRLARGLTSAQCGQIVEGFDDAGVICSSDVIATDGWSLATRGKFELTRKGGRASERLSTVDRHLTGGF